MTRGKRRLARPRGKRRNVWISLAAAAILLIGGGVIYIKHDLVERVVFSVLDRGEKTEEESTLIATAPGPRRPCDSAPTLEQGPACGAWWGVYVPPEGSLRRSVESLERKVGRTFDIVFAYHDMSTTENGELLRDDEPKIGRERLLLLGWESERWELGDNIPWATIASGRLDKEIIDPQAKRIKKYGKPVLIGFDGEMELREDSGTPADYVAAYRHIVDRFRKLGVDNVAWVWAVTGYLDYSKRWKAFYPGGRLRRLDQLRPLQLRALPQRALAELRGDGPARVQLVHPQRLRAQAVHPQRVRHRERPRPPEGARGVVQGRPPHAEEDAQHQGGPPVERGRLRGVRLHPHRSGGSGQLRSGG